MNGLQRSWEVLRCELWRARVISSYKSPGKLKVLLCSITCRTITDTCIGHVCHNPFCSSASFPGIIDTDIIKACLHLAVRLCYYTKGWQLSPCSFTWPLTSIVVTTAVKAMDETEQENLIFRNPLSLLLLLLKKSWGVWCRLLVKYRSPASFLSGSCFRFQPLCSSLLKSGMGLWSSLSGSAVFCSWHCSSFADVHEHPTRGGLDVRHSWLLEFSL